MHPLRFRYRMSVVRINRINQNSGIIKKELKMFRKNSIILFVVIAVLAVLFVPAFAQDDDVLIVAMVITSKINDYSFSQSMNEALKKIGESYP